MASGHAGPLRAACFGAGWVTVNRHIPAMRATGRFEVGAIVDKEEGRAAEAAQSLGVQRYSAAETASDLPFLDDLDVVICGTPPFRHYGVVKSALVAGKHVLCEKPLTMTVDECEELIALAACRDLRLAVVHNFQFMSSALRMQHWMSGRLGPVRAILAVQLSNPRRRLPSWYDDLPLGLFFDESPHMLYLVRLLAGAHDVEVVGATTLPSPGGAGRTPRHLDVQMMAGAVPISLVMNFESPLSEWHITVLGERGAATLDLFRDIATFLPNDGQHKTLGVLRSSAALTAGHWRGYVRSGPRHLRGGLSYGNQQVFTRFADAVVSGRDPDGIGPGDALDVVRLQHAIVERSVPAEGVL